MCGDIGCARSIGNLDYKLPRAREYKFAFPSGHSKEFSGDLVTGNADVTTVSLRVDAGSGQCCPEPALPVVIGPDGTPATSAIECEPPVGAWDADPSRGGPATAAASAGGSPVMDLKAHGLDTDAAPGGLASERGAHRGSGDSSSNDHVWQPECLILACDGVWDVLGNTDAGIEAVRVLRGLDYRGRSRAQRRSRREAREQARSSEASGDSRDVNGATAVPLGQVRSLEAADADDRLEWGSARSAARRIVELAFKMGSHDNVTCVVVDLRRPLGEDVGQNGK